MGTGHEPGAKRNSSKHGKAKPPSRSTPRAPGRAYASEEEFIAAIHEYGGDCYLMSVALDMAYQSVRARIYKNPELALIRADARRLAWADVMDQAEDNVRSRVTSGSIEDSWKILAIKDPKGWAAIARSEQTVTVIQATAEDHAAFERADSLEDAIILEKQKAQALADEVRALKRKIELLPAPDIVDGEVVTDA
jgi:hypothetical protein